MCLQSPLLLLARGGDIQRLKKRLDGHTGALTLKHTNYPLRSLLPLRQTDTQGIIYLATIPTPRTDRISIVELTMATRQSEPVIMPKLNFDILALAQETCETETDMLAFMHTCRALYRTGIRPLVRMGPRVHTSKLHSSIPSCSTMPVQASGPSTACPSVCPRRLAS